jgi:hypothetical protein
MLLLVRVKVSDRDPQTNDGEMTAIRGIETEVVIDRFEGAYALCEKEDRKMISVERKKLPDGAKEGDVLVVNGGFITIDVRETSSRSEGARKIADNSWK